MHKLLLPLALLACVVVAACDSGTPTANPGCPAGTHAYTAPGQARAQCVAD